MPIMPARINKNPLKCIFFYHFIYNLKHQLINMGKFYVTVVKSLKKYRVCREDIQSVFAQKKKITPAIPRYRKFEKDLQFDRLTN